MTTTPNPAAVPGILPDIDRPEDDLPPGADPHFGHDDSDDDAKRAEPEPRLPEPQPPV